MEWRLRLLRALWDPAPEPLVEEGEIPLLQWKRNLPPESYPLVEGVMGVVRTLVQLGGERRERWRRRLLLHHRRRHRPTRRFPRPPTTLPRYRERQLDRVWPLPLLSPLLGTLRGYFSRRTFGLRGQEMAAKVASRSTPSPSLRLRWRHHQTRLREEEKGAAFRGKELLELLQNRLRHRRRRWLAEGVERQRQRQRGYRKLARKVQTDRRGERPVVPPPPPPPPPSSPLRRFHYHFGQFHWLEWQRRWGKRYLRSCYRGWRGVWERPRSLWRHRPLQRLMEGRWWLRKATLPPTTAPLPLREGRGRPFLLQGGVVAYPHRRPLPSTPPTLPSPSPLPSPLPSPSPHRPSPPLALLGLVGSLLRSGRGRRGWRHRLRTTLRRRGGGRGGHWGGGGIWRGGWEGRLPPPELRRNLLSTPLGWRSLPANPALPLLATQERLEVRRWRWEQRSRPWMGWHRQFFYQVSWEPELESERGDITPLPLTRSYALRPKYVAEQEAEEEEMRGVAKAAPNPHRTYSLRIHRRHRYGQQPLRRWAPLRLERGRLSYALRQRLLGLLLEVGGVIPTAAPLLRRRRLRRHRRRLLALASRPCGRALVDPRCSTTHRWIPRRARLYQELATITDPDSAQLWPVDPLPCRLVVRPTAEGQLHRHRLMQLEPELGKYLDYHTLSLILSPRRNNVAVILQPKQFQQLPGEKVFERTAGQRSKFKGYLRRSYANRRGLLEDASFRLLRFHKKDRRFRFLEVTLKAFAETLGSRQLKQPGRLQRHLRGLLFPFHRRQVSLRYPIINLQLEGFHNTRPKGHPFRSKKHKRAPKLRAYLPW